MRLLAPQTEFALAIDLHSHGRAVAFQAKLLSFSPADCGPLLVGFFDLIGYLPSLAAIVSTAAADRLYASTARVEI